MSKKLMGKVAIVTGGSKGIGASIAKELAEEGASVVVNYFTSKEEADRVVQSIKIRGGKSIAIQADITNASAHKVEVRTPRTGFLPQLHGHECVPSFP